MSDVTQRDVFLADEADRWFERNAAQLTSDRDDVVTEALRYVDLQPERILEIGCANGYRLEALRQRYSARCCGIEPSAQAVASGSAQFPQIELQIGAADSLPHADQSFDLVIFGFCFYLIDPAMHLRCVAEADRVLRDGGYLAIFDFQSPVPYHNSYSHRPGLRSYKFEFSRYFLAHPAYNMIHRQLNTPKGAARDPDRREGVDLLLKDMDRAFPANPYVIRPAAP